jgi:hypothetical protein
MGIYRHRSGDFDRCPGGRLPCYGHRAPQSHLGWFFSDVPLARLTPYAPPEALLAALAACVLAACSNGSEMLKAPAALVSSGVDAISKVELPKVEMPKIDAEPIGSPTEVYTRIGRGVMTCWFGTQGPLKGAYIYHADAQATGRGDRSEIVIHEKDLKLPDPRGNRAFRIQIEPYGENARVEAENFRFPIETAQKMTADIRRFARDDLSCTPKAQTKGWDANASPPSPDPVKKPAKGAERRT